MKNILNFIKECYKGNIWNKIGISSLIIWFISSIGICVHSIFSDWWLIKIIGLIMLCLYSFAFGVLFTEDF